MRQALLLVVLMFLGAKPAWASLPIANYAAGVPNL